MLRSARDRPQRSCGFRQLENGSETRSQAAERLDGIQSMAAVDEVLALQLLTTAWRESHTEVGEAREPWPGFATLFRDGFRLSTLQHVYRLRCRGDAQVDLGVGCGAFDLDPHLIDVSFVVGEEADAVPG